METVLRRFREIMGESDGNDYGQSILNKNVIFKVIILHSKYKLAKKSKSKCFPICELVVINQKACAESQTL